MESRDQGFNYFPEAERRYDWTSGDCDYIGRHSDIQAATSDTKWRVWKLTWDSGNLTLKQGPLTGSWDGRDTLDWS